MLKIQRLGASLVLSGCLLVGCDTAAEKKSSTDVKVQQDAEFYLRSCARSLEALRTRPEGDGTLPAAVAGQPCDSAALGDYNLPAEMSDTVKSSVIRIDDERLSAYTIEITGLDGKLYSYRDRGVHAAQQEEDAIYADDKSTVFPQERAEDEKRTGGPRLEEGSSTP